MSNRQGHPLDIVVCIVYKLDKATRLLDVYLKDLATELRKDLDAVKIPRPPEANIRPPSLDGVVFSWTTRKYSVRHRRCDICLDLTTIAAIQSDSQC